MDIWILVSLKRDALVSLSQAVQFGTTHLLNWNVLFFSQFLNFDQPWGGLQTFGEFKARRTPAAGAQSFIDRVTTVKPFFQDLIPAPG
jgi:hypothetical protein